MIPAHKTKHLPLLVDYPFGTSRFSLTQSDDGSLQTTGSTLWLGAQVLSLYLLTVVNIQLKPGHRPVKAIELGSGIGLSALALASMGCDVLATDVPNVISSVLNSNVSKNLPNLPLDSGTIQVRELDWTIPPNEWTWDDHQIIASPHVRPSSSSSDKAEEILKPPFDFIITSDTLYNPDLIHPLFRSIHALSTLPASSSCTSRSPITYLCVERRDPILIDRALGEAKELWGFKTERIAHKKLVKVMEKADFKWDREDWEGIEIWKLVSTRNTRDKS